MDMNDYMRTMAKPNYTLVVSKVSIFIGGVLCFISLFLGAPQYFYTLGIGLAFVLVWLICKIVVKVKNKSSSTPTTKKKKDPSQKKYKPVYATPIDGDSRKVLVVCPKCGKKIRVPNSNGKHGVKCPSCDLFFKIIIK